MSRKIIGVTVGTSLPKPNFDQTDPRKGDYIKNKPDFDGLKSKVERIEVRVDTMQENAYDDTELRGIVSENVAKIDTLNELVGNTKVETQIGDAVATLESEISNKANISYVDEKFDSITEFDPTELQDAIEEIQAEVDGKASADHNHNSVYDVLGAASSVQENLDAVSDTLDAHTSNSDIHFTSAERTKLSGIAAGAQVNTVTGVKGNSESTYRTGNINITKENIGLSNVDNTADSAKSVKHATSADSATSATKATQDASGNVITSTYETKTDANAKLTEAKSYTDTKVSGLASTTIVDNKISSHNSSTSAHSDIRALIEDLTTKLNNFLDVDDTTTDQLSEVLTLIENNKGTLDSLTSSKINVSDIVDNLTTSSASKVLSAKQGVAIKGLIDALQAELDDHTHAIADVSGLQTALDGKAASSHGTHVSYSSTAPVMDGTASVGSASTVARSDHKHPTDTSRASQSEFDTHVDDTTSHMTSTQKTQLSTAYSHSQAAHAPSNAQANQNAFSNIKVDTTTIEADTATDTLTLVAGSNVTITPDATNDKITIAATDTVYTHPTYTAKSSGLYKVTVDNTGHVSGTAAVAKSDITALGIPAQDTTYSVATTSSNGLMSASDKAKLDSTNVSYGTCDTAADVAAKVVSLSGNTNWKLTTGSIIMVSFTNTNTAEGVTINVNNTGAYPIWYNASEYTSAGNAYTGYAGRVTTYMFNGTHWVWVSNSYDANTQSNTNSSDTSKKIYLVGATSQGTNKTTYSHDTVYADTDGHVYSNGKQVVNLSDSQALTNKTYNGYTLGAACAKGVATSATSGNSNLITSGAVYSAVNGGHNHQAEAIAPGGIEFHPGSSASHGGYIDFHYNDSTSDYTSRIIESPSGTLTLNGNKILTKADIVDVYNATITFTNGVATYNNSNIKKTSVCIVQRRGGSVGANLSFCTTSNNGSVSIYTDANYNGNTAVNMTISNL